MPNPKLPPKTDAKPEEDWEEEVVIEALGDALLPDGNIDFDKLRSTGLTLTLDELHSSVLNWDSHAVRTNF